MEMTGERRIDASPAAVWAALNDPEILKACISGCESMEKTSPTQFEAVVVQKVGPVRARFSGEVELSDIVEGQSYRINGRGKGGAAGAASGGASVELVPADGGTLLKYEAEAKVTGKIAQLGQRLIASFAKKMADDFFDRFKEQVEADGAGAAATTAAGAAGAAGAGAAGAAAAGAENLEAAARQVASEMNGALNDAGSAIAEETKSARESFEEISKEIDEETRNIAGTAGDMADKVTGAIGSAAESAYVSARSAVKDVFDEGEDGKSRFDHAAEEVEEHSKKAAHDLAGPVDRVTDAIGDAASEVRKAVEESPVAKKSFWKRLFGG